MDLEDNETAMTSFDTQVEDLKGTIESLEAKLVESKAQVKKKCNNANIYFFQLETLLEG